MRDGLPQGQGFFAGAQPLSLAQAEAALRLLADPNGRNVRIAVLAARGIEHDAARGAPQEIAERWSIPVATTLRAKGVLPEDHELSLGVFGYAGTPPCHQRESSAASSTACSCSAPRFNERDTMHWTVRERAKALMIHVNIDMDELTANGDLGHVVAGSCHAFLDLMHERAALLAPALEASRPARARVAGEDQGHAAALRRRELQRASSPIHPATRDRGVAPGIAARRHRAH
jgi:acetolactate synthase-1/2/3 large subunit